MDEYCITWKKLLLLLAVLVFAFSFLDTGSPVFTVSFLKEMGVGIIIYGSVVTFVTVALLKI